MQQPKNNYDIAKNNKDDVWQCPNCLNMINIGSYPATSRKDNKTQICFDCGITEALNDFARIQPK